MIYSRLQEGFPWQLTSSVRSGVLCCVCLGLTTFLCVTFVLCSEGACEEVHTLLHMFGIDHLGERFPCADF
jgi:hypothetical protein